MKGRVEHSEGQKRVSQTPSSQEVASPRQEVASPRQEVASPRKAVNRMDPRWLGTSWRPQTQPGML